MQYFEYLGVKFGCDFEKSLEEIILSFLGDYFESTSDSSNLRFTVKLINDKYSGVEKFIQYGKETIIVNSKDPAVLEKGYYSDSGFVRYVYNSYTKGVYYINYFTKVILIYNKDLAMLARESIRVLRSIVKEIVEKEKNAVMYHGASLYGSNGEGILLIGDKGTGKTTLSLKLILEHNFVEVSRDRVFLEKTGNDFMIYGWPCYYNLTLRTITSFKQTECMLPQKFQNFTEKELDNVDDKIKYLTRQDIGITENNRKCQLTHIFLLQNKSNIYEEQDIIEKSCFTYKDTSFTNWHEWNKEDKTHIYENATNMTRELLDFKRTTVIGKSESLDKVVEKILRVVKTTTV